MYDCIISTIGYKDWIFTIASDDFHLDLAIKCKDGVFIIVEGFIQLGFRTFYYMT